MMKRRIAAMGLALLMMAVTVGCSGKNTGQGTTGLSQGGSRSGESRDSGFGEAGGSNRADMCISKLWCI